MEASIPVALKVNARPANWTSYLTGLNLYAGNLVQEYPLTLVHVQVWDFVKTTIDTVTRSQTKNDDDYGWYEVINTILEGFFGKSIAGALQLYMYEVKSSYSSIELYEDIQHSSLVKLHSAKRFPSSPISNPTISGAPLPFKKANFGVSFSNDDLEANELYMKVFKTHPKICIS